MIVEQVEEPSESGASSKVQPQNLIIEEKYSQSSNNDSDQTYNVKIDPNTRANQLMQIEVSDDESVNSHMILNLKDNLRDQDSSPSK